MRHESGGQVEPRAVRPGHVAHSAEAGRKGPAGRAHPRHGAPIA